MDVVQLWVFSYNPKLYSSRTACIIFFKIKATVSLSHQSLYFSVIFWTSLAPGIKTTLLKLSNFFFYLLWRKNCKIWWKKSSAWKGEKKIQPFTISVSRFTLLEKKRNNFIGSRCWHCVSYWRWKESSWTITVTKGYWWQLEFLWLITFIWGRRTAESRNWDQDRNQPVDFNM